MARGGHVQRAAGGGGAASTTALALLAACALPSLRGVAAAPRKGAGKAGWRLSHHSFERTLSYDDTLGDWLASAGSIPLRDRLQIVPPVPDRYGFFWSKKPVTTRDFEVTFTVSASDNGEAKRAPLDGAFAFWLSPDSLAAQYNEQAVVSVPSKDWDEGLQKVGLTLLSNKPNFRGLAMTFSDAATQTVSALWNDGAKTRVFGDLTSTASGAQSKALKWMTAGTQVKVRVTPDGAVKGSVMTLDVQKHIVGSLWGFAEDGVTSKNMISFQADGKVTWDDGPAHGGWYLVPGNKMGLTMNNQTYVIRFEGSNRAVVENSQAEPQPILLYGGQDTGVHEDDWQVVFTLPPGTFPGGEAYMGFSAYTGSKSYIEVDMHRLETVNFDAKVAGEDDSDVLEAQLAEWLEVLESEKKYLDQASQSEAVLRLTQLLSTHVERCDKDGDKLKENLIKMEERLDTLGSDMSTHLAAVKAYSFESQQFEPEVLKGHIIGIKAIFVKSKGIHDEKVRRVQQAAKDLKTKGGTQLTESSKRKVISVQEQSKAVEDFAAAGSSQTNMLLLILCAAVAGLGFLFLNRMRYYEKKHYI
mmetsp:Transcript_93572/g.238256  ORF Transcript_93572/g.238256 Transcript_93572/m.238256 type:complete len:583 (-) Transcript_93572:159-1907(-)